MEKRFQSLSLFEFQSLFPDDNACLQYLADTKWSNGFKCSKCGHEKYCKVKQPHSRQCTKCRLKASPTSNTLFHKVKFPLLKAFYIVYFVSTNKKGISSTELSRKLNLRQKTCWSFKRKVMKAMASSGNYQPLNEKKRVFQGYMPKLLTMQAANLSSLSLRNRSAKMQTSKPINGRDTCPSRRILRNWYRYHQAKRAATSLICTVLS